MLFLFSSFVYATEIEVIPKFYEKNINVNENNTQICFIQIANQKAFDWVLFKNDKKCANLNNQNKIIYELKIPRKTEPSYYNLTYNLDDQQKQIQFNVLNPTIKKIRDFFTQSFEIMNYKINMLFLISAVLSISLLIVVLYYLIKFLNE